ncbi:MAG: TldD/PmbA family protein [Candidatus Bathyarchaeia archaeon]|jgi:PmbA protein|nr:TldD/PmbA family protein [Candidatus Bathyarchaeota archaeon A05DMB-4]MDH7594695.1 TldD/PmbA family protein [Candidatus Bathyarchaeota archaeon]
MSLDEKWMMLGDYVRKTIRKLERKGITHAEAFFTSTRTTEVAIRNSEILTQNRADDDGVGFRVVIEKNKVGFACTNELSEKAVLEAGEKALAIAKVSSEVPNFALPAEGTTSKVNGLFDVEVAEVNVEDVVDIAKRAIDAAEEYDKRVIAKDGRVVFMAGWRGVVNTLGVDCEERETRTALYLAGGGEHDGEVTSSCSDYTFKRTPNLNPENLGENVAKKVISMFNPKPITSFQGTVIFGPEAVSYQLCDVLVDALKGENVIAGRSAWTRRIGEMVASENLTITDSATLEGGFASRSFDDEGAPSQNTVAIREGKLESFLHNATTANALKTKNTGNASRFPGGLDMVRMIVGNGYKAKPEVYPSNLVIQPGNKSKETLLAEIDKGVLIEYMGGFAQAGSGLISAQLSQAFYIQNGEIQHPIKGGMVSGVAFDWFKQICGIGNDSKQFVNSFVPSLMVGNVKIIGA